MSEVEKIYEFVFDKAYLDKVQLSILLDNLNDKKLARGFLNSLCILHKRYEISEEHKSELLLLYLEVFGEPSKEDIIETSAYFTEKMRGISNSRVSNTELRIKSLNFVMEYLKSKKDKSVFEECDLKTLYGIKAIMLDCEIYEDITMIDELIEKMK
jgi:hypothetical protein